MKTLLAYYSRTGVTRKIAEALAEMLSADIEELVDTKKRSGRLGFLVACKDAVMKKNVPIEPVKNSPADYDMVVVGTPVWAKTMCSAVRTYLSEHCSEIKQSAVFCTTHTDGIKETLADMLLLTGQDATAAAGFRQKHVKRDEHIAALEAFADKIKNPLDASMKAQ